MPSRPRNAPTSGPTSLAVGNAAPLAARARRRCHGDPCGGVPMRASAKLTQVPAPCSARPPSVGPSDGAVELLPQLEGQPVKAQRDHWKGGADGAGRGNSAGGAAMDRASALHRTAPDGRCSAASPPPHCRHTTSTRVGSNRPPRFAAGFTTTASRTDWMMARRCSIARVGQSASTSAGRLVTAT